MIDLPDAVLVMTAWRRPDYLEKALASWTRARGASRLGGLVVALGPSEHEERQRDTIELAARTLGVDVTIRPDSPAAQASPGMHRALGETLTWVRDELGPAAVICAEEDLVVSDDVLEYMQWALNRFVSDPAVVTVLAHDVGGQGWDIPGIGQQGFGAAQDRAALQCYFNPWVWATWCGPRLDFLLARWDWDATKGPVGWQHGYDWQIRRVLLEQGLLSVVPAASRSQNIGRDGGVYARPELFDQTQSASFRKHRDPTAYQLTGDQ